MAKYCMQLLPDAEQSRVLIKALKVLVQAEETTLFPTLTKREIEIAEELELEMRKKLRKSGQ